MAEHKRLGKYEILEEIGRGGFAVVYKARDTTLDREMVLKVMHPQLLVDPVFVQRFQTEAQALARLRHPHIITVYEVAETEGNLYIAMELARGPSLATAIIEQGCIPWEETLALLRPIGEALDYAHQLRIVHRDLKPSNILLDEERGPLLVDFGLSRILDTGVLDFTPSSAIVGTPAYIAPEIWDGEEGEAPADIYALGCIAYEILTGKVLFSGSRVMQIAGAHHKGPQFPAQWPESVPDGLERVLGKALAREPLARFVTAGRMVEALGRIEANEKEVSPAIEMKTEQRAGHLGLESVDARHSQRMVYKPSGPVTQQFGDVTIHHPNKPALKQLRQTSWQTYQDFVLRIWRAGGDTYSVEAQGPTGEARSTFERPFDEKDLQIFLLQVGHPRRIAVRGRVPAPMKQTVDFGGKLYNAVFSGDVRDVFIRARQDAERGKYGLRLKLRLTDTPDLADVPWEFLYNGHDFLALSPDTPIVRYLDLPRSPRPMKVDLPLRVLVTISSPHGFPPLDVQAERTYVHEALAPMEELVQIDFLTDVTLRGFQRKLRQAKQSGHPYHIWHYIGHGSFDQASASSVLMFCDRDGMPSPVGGFQLGTLFDPYPEMRLVLLNACEGARADIQDPFAGVAAALVERGVPAVIGMQFEISNEAATVFAEGFYTSIVDGLPVDAALTEARRSVFFLPNWIEWATPVLYMRAPDGVLFDIQET